MANKTHRIVHVKWQDSRSLTSTWEGRKHSIRRARSSKLIESAGFVIHETKDEILLAMDYDPESDQINNASTIPKGMIKKLREL